MFINKERLEDIRGTFQKEDQNGITFVKLGQGRDSIYPSWTVSQNTIIYFQKAPTGGSHTINEPEFVEISDKEFLQTVAETPMEALIFIQWKNQKELYDYSTEWEQLAVKLGISSMVAISTKVPEVIAKRFGYFAADEGQTTSSQLRHLVLNYVEQQWKENAGRLILKEDI